METPRPFDEIPSPPKSWVPLFGHGVLMVKKPAGIEQSWKNVAELVIFLSFKLQIALEIP